MFYSKIRMTKSVWIRTFIFLAVSAVIGSVLASQLKLKETSIAVTLCGGSPQPFDYFSSDYTYSQRVSYPGGNMGTTIRFKPSAAKPGMGHRFDFGGKEGEVFLISSIVLEKPGYKRYVLDLDRADEWIRRSNQIKKPMMLNHQLLIETTGNDGYLVTTDQLFESFAKPQFNISWKKIFAAAVAELILLLLLLAYPLIVQGIICIVKMITVKEFLITSAVFMLINLVLILPAAYFYCRNLPDVFSITLKAKQSFPLEIFYKTPYSQQASRSETYSDSEKYQTLNIPLPNDAERNRIRIDFGSSIQTISVKSIAIIRYGLFRYALDFKQAPEVYPVRHHIGQFHGKKNLLNLSTSGKDPYITPSAEKYDSAQKFRIAFGQIFWCVAGIEILLLLILSQTIRKLILKISPVRLSNKENLILSLSVAGAFAFIMVFSLPLQTFKMAEEIILFKMNVLLNLLYYLVPIVFIGLAVILFSLNRRYGAVFSFLLASIIFLFALESGLLSFHLPELNGDFDAYYNIPRMAFHIIVWLIGFLLPLCFQKKIFRWIPLFMLGVCIMNAASLIDSLMKKNLLEGRGKLIVPSTVNIEGTIEKVKYAKKNNIIMICLDGVTTESVCEMFKEYPELKKHYQGFTLFTNNIGMNIGTMWAVPGFFTGKIITSKIPTNEYTSSMYSKDSAVKKYMDKKYALFLRIGLTHLSYIYPDSGISKKVTLLTPVEGSMLQWMFHELFLFKISPFFLKGKLMQYYFYHVWPKRTKISLDDGSSGNAFSRDENYIYRKLAEAPLLDAEFPGAFHYHHFIGGHQPFKYDKDGKPVDRSKIPWKTDWQGYYERVIFEMKRVAAYFQSLKNRGLYDDSVIIILADHGLEPTLDKKNVNPRFRPLLMVKCRNSESKLDFCNLPTSHTRIAEFLKSDDIFLIKQKNIPKIFYTKIRKIAENRDRVYMIDQNRKVLSINPLKSNFSLVENVKIDFKYSLFNIANDSFPPISYNNLNEQFQGLMIHNSSPCNISFKVWDKSALYTVTFTGFMNDQKKDDIYVRIKSNSGSKAQFNLTDKKFILSHVRPDNNGIIKIHFKRQGDSGHLFLTSLTVNKERH